MDQVELDLKVLLVSDGVEQIWATHNPVKLDSVKFHFGWDLGEFWRARVTILEPFAPKSTDFIEYIFSEIIDFKSEKELFLSLYNNSFVTFVQMYQ